MLCLNVHPLVPASQDLSSQRVKEEPPQSPESSGNVNVVDSSDEDSQQQQQQQQLSAQLTAQHLLQSSQIRTLFGQQPHGQQQQQQAQSGNGFGYVIKSEPGAALRVCVHVFND